MQGQGGPGNRRLSTDRYKDFEAIYNGAISTVFYATDRNTGKEVVLKAYHKEVMDERHYLRLAREVRVQQSIQHRAAPRVCRLLDHFEDARDIFLVLERCLGGDVFALRSEVGGSLNEAYVCTVRAHAYIVLHRSSRRILRNPMQPPR